MKPAILPAVLAAFALALVVCPAAQAGPRGGRPSGRPLPPPHHHHHHHHHHTHWQPTPPPPPVVVETPYQNVRYLKVVNNTGENLTVYVRGGDGQTRQWNFSADQTAYLAVDDVRITESEVGIWASSESKTWSRHKEGITLVSAPYASNAIGTFTYTFN